MRFLISRVTATLSARAFALASTAAPLALCSRCPALASRSPNSVVNSPVAENLLLRRVRQRLLGEVPVLHVEAVALGGRPLLGILLRGRRGDNDRITGLPVRWRSAGVGIGGL